MKEFVFIEYNETGHYLEYLALLVRYFVAYPQAVPLTVLAPDTFVSRYHAYFGNELPAVTNFSFQALTPAEISRLRCGSPLQMQHSVGRIICQRIGPPRQYRIFFDEFNKYQISWSRAFDPRSLVGIYYAPYSRLHRNSTGTSGTTLRNRVTLFRKKALLSLAVKSGQWRKIFVLNDKAVARHLNRMHQTDVFTYLPDPIWEPEERPGVNVAADWPLSAKNRTTFLLFGSLGERKGFRYIVDALRLLPPELRGRLRLLVAGQAVPGFAGTMQGLVAETGRLCGPDGVVWIDRYVTANEMDLVFDCTDYVLNTTLNVNASSGVMGHAARKGKVAITSKHGLYGVLANRYKLGPVVDPKDPQAIARAVERLLTGGGGDYPRTGMQQYAIERDWRHFAQAIFSAFR